MLQIEILELYARRFVSFRLTWIFATDKSFRVILLKLWIDYGLYMYAAFQLDIPVLSFKTLRVCLSCIIRWYGQSNYDYAFSWYVDAHIMTRTAPIARYLNNSSIHRTSSWGPFISWTIKIICGGLVQMWHRTIEDSKWLVHASDHQWSLTFPLIVL